MRDIAEEKLKIRRKYLDKRDALTDKERDGKSELIMRRISGLSCFKEAKSLLIYAAFGSEVNTLGFIEELLADKDKKIFLPKVTGSLISFYRIYDISELQKGYMGIPEPVFTEKERLFTERESIRKSVCVTPGTVFDSDLNRMGYGKGYYDRFFATFPHIIKIGVAFDVQISDTPLPGDINDVRLEHIVTESRYI